MAGSRSMDNGRIGHRWHAYDTEEIGRYGAAARIEDQVALAGRSFQQIGDVIGAVTRTALYPAQAIPGVGAHPHTHGHIYITVMPRSYPGVGCPRPGPSDDERWALPPLRGDPQWSECWDLNDLGSLREGGSRCH